MGSIMYLIHLLQALYNDLEVSIMWNKERRGPFPTGKKEFTIFLHMFKFYTEQIMRESEIEHIMGYNI